MNDSRESYISASSTPANSLAPPATDLCLYPSPPSSEFYRPPSSSHHRYPTYRLIYYLSGVSEFGMNYESPTFRLSQDHWLALLGYVRSFLPYSRWCRNSNTWPAKSINLLNTCATAATRYSNLNTSHWNVSVPVHRDTARLLRLRNSCLSGVLRSLEHSGRSSTYTQALYSRLKGGSSPLWCPWVCGSFPVTSHTHKHNCGYHCDCDSVRSRSTAVMALIAIVLVQLGQLCSDTLYPPAVCQLTDVCG